MPVSYTHLDVYKRQVVNLEKTEPEEARKIFDFLNGSVYALDGKIQKIANGVFILAPNNVDIPVSYTHLHEAGGSNPLTQTILLYGKFFLPFFV